MSSRQSPTALARPVRVLTVDDDASFLDLLREVVEATPDFEVVAEADCGERAIEIAGALSPNLILMDVRMPGVGGIRAAKRIKETSPSAVIVLISTTHPDELSQEAHQGAADAIVWKSELAPKLLRNVWDRATRAEPGSDG